MYIVELTYTVSIADVDAKLDAHKAWIDKEFAAGRMVACGRKDPRDGGVLLFAPMPRAELDAVLAGDPFTAVADYRVITFAATRTVEALTSLRA